MTRANISQADLADKTQEVVNRVQHGEIAFVEQSGREQAVLMDPLDFRLLRALADCAISSEESDRFALSTDGGALGAYLAEQISLGKAADLLGLSRFELQERFLRLGVPLHLGPSTLAEARAEVAAALRRD